MADLPITGLPAASLPLLGDEPLALVRGGVTSQVPASALGSWILVSHIDAAADATVDFEDDLNSDFTAYVVIIDNLMNSNSGANLFLRVGNGAVYDTNFYQYFSAAETSTGVSNNASNQLGSSILLNGSDDMASISTRASSWTIYATSNTFDTIFYWTGVFNNSGNQLVASAGSGGRIGGNNITSIRFLISSGTMTGKFSLFGIRRA